MARKLTERYNIWIDPRGRPRVTVGSDHWSLFSHVLSVHPSVRSHFSKYRKTKQLSSENSDRYWRDCGSGRVDHWRYTFLVICLPVPPDIDDGQSSSDVIVSEGDDATLSCKAKGHPRPRVEWLREDKKEFAIFDPRNNSTRKNMGKNIYSSRQIWQKLLFLFLKDNKKWLRNLYIFYEVKLFLVFYVMYLSAFRKRNLDS